MRLCTCAGACMTTVLAFVRVDRDGQLTVGSGVLISTSENKTCRVLGG